MANRFSPEYGTEARASNVAFIVDMSPATVLEQQMDGGYDRTTKPVGEATATRSNLNGTGSRGASDAVAASKLGLPVINER
jgi:hypothetical protein